MSEPTYEEALAHFGTKGMKWGVRNDKSGGSSESSKPGMSTKKKVAIGVGAVAAVGAVTAAAVISRNRGVSISQFQTKAMRSKKLALDQEVWRQNVAKLSADIHSATAEQNIISRRNLNTMPGQKITDAVTRARLGLPN